MTVNPFNLDDPVVNALKTSLSPERMATYIAKTNGDHKKAVRLYTWNTAASAAFYGPLQWLEVTLRNAMHRELSKKYGLEWYDNKDCGFDIGTEKRIDNTKREVCKHKHDVDPPHVVAELSFGFWVTLLGPGGKAPDGTNRNYEMTLWRKCLHNAFSHKKLARRGIHKPLDDLRNFRNRIAHHSHVDGILNLPKDSPEIRF